MCTKDVDAAPGSQNLMDAVQKEFDASPTLESARQGFESPSWPLYIDGAAVIRGGQVATDEEMAGLNNPYESGYVDATGLPRQDELDELKQHEEELRREREIDAQRVVPEFDNDDLNALLRAFDKVSIPYDRTS